MAQNNANKIVNAINEVVEVNQNDVKIAPAGAPANLNAPPSYNQTSTLKAPVQAPVQAQAQVPVQAQVQTQVTQVAQAPQIAQVQAPIQVQPQVQQIPMVQQQMPMIAPQVMQQPIIQQPIMQQPVVQQAAPAPIIINNNGNVLKTHYHFSNELCGCCSNPGLCLLSCFCPCIPVGQAAEAAGCGNCIVCATACFFFPAVACCVRGAVRRKRNIVGDCCSDCCVLMCCQVCAISQMARESGAYQMGEHVEKVEKAVEAKEDNVFMISHSIARE